MTTRIIGVKGSLETFHMPKRKEFIYLHKSRKSLFTELLLLIVSNFSIQVHGGLKVNIQFFSYRLAKPSKPIFFPKVAKSEANWRFSHKS